MGEMPNGQHDDTLRGRARRALNRVDCPPEARQVLQDMLNEFEKPASLAWMSSAYSLSDTESQILEYLAQGYTPAQIASQTGRKITTVRVHQRNLYQKTRVNHIAGLLALVIQGPRRPTY